MRHRNDHEDTEAVNGQRHCVEGYRYRPLRHTDREKFSLGSVGRKRDEMCSKRSVCWRV